MKKMKDIMLELEEKERDEVAKTIDECMKRICCENVDWRNFAVYDSSVSTITNILRKMEIHFLLPIAEEVVMDEAGREVRILITSTKDKQDDVWFVRVDTTKLLARIECSSRTMKYLQAE